MMQKQVVRWRTFDTAANLQDAACEAILQWANEAIAARGRFLVVLAGGTTPDAVYQRLCAGQTDWSKWQVYFGDERCLPPDHAERNSLKASEAWLQHVPIPPAQIHPIPAELGAVAAAACYAALLDKVGEFDLVLLGLGEDGHTASLFPGLPWAGATAAVIPVSGAPKPPQERVSLSATRLSHASHVLYLVSGEGKRAAVREWQKTAHLPAAAVVPQRGVDVWMDQAAADPSLPL